LQIVFEGVSNAVMAVYDMVKPGTPWPECHLAAGREILKAMQKLGCVRADVDIEAALADDVAAVFMPHGLGHLIGCDTHDVGGYLDGTPDRGTRPGLKVPSYTVHCTRTRTLHT
jgi:Xaa-Pro dipeptidase